MMERNYLIILSLNPRSLNPQEKLANEHMLLHLVRDFSFIKYYKNELPLSWVQEVTELKKVLTIFISNLVE